jgi:hypothetical protein
MNPWLRPSIQQPRKIRQVVDKLFSPLTNILQYGKDYWDTWHKVYQPEGKKDGNK